MARNIDSFPTSDLYRICDTLEVEWSPPEQRDDSTGGVPVSTTARRPWWLPSPCTPSLQPFGLYQTSVKNLGIGQLKRITSLSRETNQVTRYQRNSSGLLFSCLSWVVDEKPLVDPLDPKGGICGCENIVNNSLWLWSVRQSKFLELSKTFTVRYYSW